MMIANGLCKLCINYIPPHKLDFTASLAAAAAAGGGAAAAAGAAVAGRGQHATTQSQFQHWPYWKCYIIKTFPSFTIENTLQTFLTHVYSTKLLL